MKNRITAGRLATVIEKNIGTFTFTVCKPDFREFTLIRTDERGRTIKEEKVMVDVNKIFRTV